MILGADDGSGAAAGRAHVGQRPWIKRDTIERRTSCETGSKMGATVFDILGAAKDLGWNSAKDFVLGDGKAVPIETIVDEPNWSLYSLDLDQGQGWFVELPQGTDLSGSVFAFRDQRRLARRLLQISLDDLITFSRRIEPPEKVIFVFSIGRCGSTLVSHVLNTSPDVWGLSEPIAFPRLIMTNYDVDRRLIPSRTRLVELIRACTKLQFLPVDRSRQKVFALKFHSQCLFQAEAYYEAFPDAAFVFLYRDAVSWTKSWYQMAQKYGYEAVMSGHKRLEIWNCITAADDLAHLRPYVDLNEASLALEDGLVHGWSRNMEEYERLLDAGVPFMALRYNELTSDRTGSVERLFRHCRLPVEQVRDSLAAFDHDSQAGDIVSADVEADAMTEAQVERAQTQLARRPRYNDPNLVLRDVWNG